MSSLSFSQYFSCCLYQGFEPTGRFLSGSVRWVIWCSAFLLVQRFKSCKWFGNRLDLVQTGSQNAANERGQSLKSWYKCNAKINYSMNQSYFGQAISSSASQEILHVLWNQKYTESLSWVKLGQSTPSHPISLRYILYLKTILKWAGLWSLYNV